MVAFWPWKVRRFRPLSLQLTKTLCQGESADFEKTLSSLSSKIADTQASLDKVRSNSRRARVLWTLYLSFAYLVYAIVLLLVVGYKNLGAYEWTGLCSGPLL